MTSIRFVGSSSNSLLLSLALGFLSLSQPVAVRSEEAVPANETAAQNRERFIKQVKQSKDLPNFHQVHPYLYRGGEPTRAGLEQLKKLGVTTVIDLRNKGERAFDEEASTHALGLEYIHMPMSSQAPTKAQVKRFLDSVADKRDHQGKGAVFLHCAHGSDRTGCLVGIWRVTQDGWQYDKTYKEMRGYWFTPKFTNLSGAVHEHWKKTLSAGHAAGTR